ncbi:sugar kinase [Aerococcus agrisoli]|uniref:Sugar kinase n=1 Tax=Aerococcus agrisoli TaxID=2487350 RepID=A0A3N4G0Y2_9LACT|nr:sugar kinase [Aerococcus agrisoli]RPA55948.1 sugar kinase [Aerococcus agrisoli]
MRKKVVTLGEILIRLTTMDSERFSQAQKLEVTYGGSEANIAATIAHLGMWSSFVTAVPDNELGNSAVEFMRKNGVHTGYMLRQGHRLGIYFAEKGYSIRPSKIVYDRKHSAFTESKITDYDMDLIFEDANWFHTSGITAALSDNLFELTKVCMQEAKKRGLKVSIDLNYRASLWDFEVARSKMAELLPYADICFGIEPLFVPGEGGRDYKDINNIKRPYDFDTLNDMLAYISEYFDLEAIALTKRQTINANRNILQSYLYTKDNLYASKVFDVDIIDRIGGGDAFAAGLIYAINSENYTPQECIEFANATFALKHTIPGDMGILTLNDVHQLMNSDEGFDVNR